MVRRRLRTKDCILSKSAVAIYRAIETSDDSVRRWCAMARKHTYTLNNVDSLPSRYVKHAQIVLKRTSNAARPFQKAASKMTSRSSVPSQCRACWTKSRSVVGKLSSTPG
ncbi:unnamed protein product [Sphagnum balticum]